MKNNLSLLLIMLMCIVSIKASAYDFEEDGIYYNYTNGRDGSSVYVTYKNYDSYYNAYNRGRSCSGEVNIPESVTSNGKTFNVTSIGNYAFSGCSGLTSVTIPNSVTSIGNYAFSGYSGLTSVTIPNSVTSIGNYAFQNCSSLTSVTFHCANIGNWFSSNTSIKEIIIGDEVTSIGNQAFKDCSGLTTVTIPNSVTAIGISTFSGCSGLTSVTIPNSVTSIGNSAFYNCSGLTSVTIPNSVTSIGEQAFFGTAWYNNQPDGIVYAGKVLYKYKGSMSDGTSVVIDEGTLSISPSAFYGCTGLTSVTISNSVTSIGEKAFYNCYLKSVTIGTGVLSIGSSTFSNDDTHYGQKTIWLTNTPPNGYKSASGSVNYVANDLYSGLSNRTVYPFLSSIFEVDGVKYVPVSPSDRTCDAIDCLYDGTTKTVHISKMVSYKGVAMTVKDIHSYALYNNDDIEEVILENDGNVGEKAFYDCDSIGSMNINNIGYIGKSAFYSSGKSCSLEVGDQVTDIQESAFQYSELTSAIIQNKGIIGANAFQGCTSLLTASIENEGSIGNNAFQGCSSLQTTTLGNKVSSLGGGAFAGCSSLQGIVIPNAVETLGQYVFSYCTSMESAIIGSGVKTIPYAAFANCSSLADLPIGKNVETIDQSAFSGCSALPKIEIPASVTSINSYVFNGCTSLNTVVMKDKESILNIGYGANTGKPIFADCPLDSVYIGRNISYNTSSNCGYSPFYRNTSLRSVTITDKETEISPNEFYGCTNLKNVRIGDGVTKIGNWAFSGCASLDYFAFGSSVESIGQEAFSDCVSVTKLISRAQNPPSCGTQALDDINKWECTLTVPEGYVDAYRNAEQWKEFFFVEGGDGGIETPEIGKCATPTISYANGELTFNCATEGVEYKSSITDSDIKDYVTSSIALTVTYHISVYATKNGYEDSDVATATLCWIDVQPQTEGVEVPTTMQSIEATPVLIQTHDGVVSVSGAPEGTDIAIYNTSGQMVGSGKATFGTTEISTPLHSGDIAIVKIGDKAVKVVVK